MSGLNSKSKAWIRLFFILSLTLVVAASAEVVDGSHNGIYGGAGRPFVDASGNVGNLGSILSSCAVGRPGAGINLGGGLGVGSAGLPPVQGGAGFEGGGIVQASIPEGAPGVAGAAGGAQASSAGAAPNGAALFQARCISCHQPGGAAAGKAISAAGGAIRVADKTMPPPNSPQAQGLSDADRAAIAAFLPSLGR